MVRHSPIIAHPSTYAAYGGKMWRGASKNTIEGPNQMPKVATRATPVWQPLLRPSTCFIRANNFSQFSFFSLVKSSPWTRKIQFYPRSFNYFKSKKSILFSKPSVDFFLNNMIIPYKSRLSKLWDRIMS
jgi:hypothetical protein